MTKQDLIQYIFSKQTYLCVGLDTDRSKIPALLRSHKNALFEFNKAIIDSTKNYCVAYKINTAFYEAEGIMGWEALEQTVDYIPSTHFKIADAKRADIGNTSAQYAKAFFETLNFDAITVAPYMGEDSIRPFLEYKNKWTIVLGLTSNPGAKDFELQKIHDQSSVGMEFNELALNATRKTEYLYEKVLRTVSGWGNETNLMFVIGATQAEELANIRTILPNYFFLVPGIGAQGGSLAEISEKAMNKDCGILLNASRAIIYASNGQDFAEKASEIAAQYQMEMSQYIENLER